MFRASPTGPTPSGAVDLHAARSAGPGAALAIGVRVEESP
jgi:hypothetical protein